MDDDDTPTTIADLLRQPLEGQETAFQVVADLEGDGKRLEIRRRRLAPEVTQEAPLATSPRRHHRFYAVAGLLNYLSAYATQDTVILANPAERRVQAILDDTAEEGGREVVTFTPQVHPRWEPFRGLLGKTLSLDELLDFVRNNRRAIDHGRELIFGLSQVTASTEVTLAKGSGRSCVNGLMVKTEIRGGGTQTDPVDLPEVLRVTTPVWVDEPPQTMEIDLVLEASRDGSEIRARLSSADLREAEITAFDSVVERIRAGAPEGSVVAHGSVHEAPWDRVPQR